MNKQEIIKRLSADEDRCKYCNSSHVFGGDIYCSAGYSHDMNCGGKEFKDIEKAWQRGLSQSHILNSKQN